MNDSQKALRELYDLLVEYDLFTQLEDEAQAYDLRKRNAAQDEYARVIGIVEGVKVALGIGEGQAAQARQDAEQKGGA